MAKNRVWWLQHSDASRVEAWPEPTTPEPDIEDIRPWVIGDELCEATDGCTVEPDGVCPHGYPSWLLYLGYI